MNERIAVIYGTESSDWNLVSVLTWETEFEDFRDFLKEVYWNTSRDYEVQLTFGNKIAFNVADKYEAYVSWKEEEVPETEAELEPVLRELFRVICELRDRNAPQSKLFDWDYYSNN